VSEPAIVARDLTRRFGAFTAVDSVSFEVPAGEIFGYLGANGAGKSTTIRMLCGLLAPTSGTARVAGHDPATDPRAVKSSIGYMSQRFSLYLDLTVRENLEFMAGAYGLSRGDVARRLDEVIGLADLGAVRDSITGALPGGVRQRVALANAILHRPRIVFLDEPTAGVDPFARRNFWKLIRDLANGGTTVFVTTHYLDEAEYCRRIGLMVDGRLIALDTTAGLKRTWVPERVMIARGRRLPAAAAALRTRPGVAAVEPFGAALHVRVDPARWDLDGVAATLREAGATDVTVAPGEATLEDVFLAAVARPATPAPEASP
jgi:ABC-2 type transport system ATP-binding protein